MAQPWQSSAIEALVDPRVQRITLIYRRRRLEGPLDALRSRSIRSQLDEALI